MAGHPGALPVGPTASNTEFEDDIDGGPPGGHCRWVWQRPPPRLKTSSMASPLGALSVGAAVSTTEFVDDVDGAPLGGTAGVSGIAHDRV
jgi:hypothetical protein